MPIAKSAPVESNGTPTPPVAKPRRGKKPVVDPDAGRPVVYPELEAIICSGPNAITEEVMEKLLGWEVIPTGAGSDAEPLLVDEEGDKIRCTNNVNNRPFDIGTAKKYAQSILNKRWAGPNGNGKTVNGEAMIFGRTARVLSAQHRGVGFKLACQRWRKDPKAYPQWPECPVLDSVVVRGVDESDETTQTIDDVRPQTLDDVLFRQDDLFQRIGEKPTTQADRKAMCRFLTFAIRCVWDRTGVVRDAYSTDLKMTHGEALAFRDRHRGLEQAVEHIFVENVNNRLKGYCSPGLASGLMYLMAASGTDTDRYLKKDAQERSEKQMDLSRWDKAEEFWVTFLQTTPDFAAVRGAIADSFDPSIGAGGGRDEVTAILVKAWNSFVSNPASLTGKTDKEAKAIMARILPTYAVEEDKDEFDNPITIRTQVEFPNLGGIDTWKPKVEEADEGDAKVEGDDEAGEETDAADEKPKEHVLSREEQLAKYRRLYRTKTLAFNDGKHLVFFGKDISTAVDLGLNLPANKKVGNLEFSHLPLVQLQEVLDTFAQDRKSLVVISESGEAVVHDPAPPAPAPSANGTAKKGAKAAAGK